MSYASKARKKAMKKAKDLEDPERTQVRNAIRRGKVPRLSMFTQKGEYVHSKLDEQGNKVKTGKTFVAGRKILDSQAVIFEAKAARNAAGKK